MKGNLLNDVKDGTYQGERRMDALLPDYFKVDEKEPSDFWAYFLELAKLFNYYNFNDEVDDDWSRFFESDVSINIAAISKFDFKTYQSQFETFITGLKESSGTAEAARNLEGIFSLFATLFSILDHWRKRFNNVTAIFKFGTEVENAIDRLNGQMDRIYALADFFTGIFDGKFHFDLSALRAIQNPEDHVELKYVFSEKESAYLKTLDTLSEVDHIFDEIKREFIHLSGASKEYMTDISQSSHAYEPHIGLLNAFLHLYKYLQRHINYFSHRHLDFYYKEILGMQLKPIVPDSVFVFFDIALKASETPVLAGALLDVEKEDNSPQIHYSIDEDLVVTKANVTDLRTILVSSDILIYPKNPDESPVTGEQAYRTTIPCANPAKLNAADYESWPILGENPDKSKKQLPNTDYADLGLIIASPLLYQKEGERHIKIYLYTDPASFQEIFESYAGAFSRSDADYGSNADDYAKEILAKSFDLSFTSTEGWEPISRFSISCSKVVAGAPQSENFIIITFNLKPEEKPIDIYNPKVHGSGYASSWPMVKLLVNNYSSYYPFTFLSGLVIEKITINVNVTDAMKFKLQNSIGIIVPVNPFQAFGPLPAIGSYLNIASTNIFNKYTCGFTINIEWLDLPVDNGGFREYYSAYIAGIQNNSFKIGISTLKGGRYSPEKGEQQVFNLFTVKETDNGDYLSDTTIIETPDIKKLEFNNDMLLAKEDITPVYELKDGIVRLEFIAPNEGFGQKIFPQIFPEVIMYNSKKRYGKKLPLPNQPYIPIIKSISVTYEIEHSETLSDLGQRSGTDIGVQLFHIHPFGQEYIYPAPLKKERYLLPDYKTPNNLYIGITDLEPGQILTLLFELDERNFRSTYKTPTIILWSYLYNNEWITFESKDVLMDGTSNFINSGIVKLQIPRLINSDNTIMPAGLYWVRAYTVETAEIISNVIGIFTNAVSATRIITAENSASADLTLAPGKITGFKQKTPGIFAVWQPFHSFWGKQKESDEYFHLRVSERLKHKQRPLSTKDYEKIVLDQFPNLLLVKCIGAGTQDELVLPGVNIQLIVISNEISAIRKVNNEPKVNMAALIAIKKYLSDYVSPFIKIEVGNPLFEKVKICCSVKFKTNTAAGNGKYLKLLNEAIKEFICPWLYGASTDVKLGASVYRSDMLNNIRNLPYVDFVTGFSMIHYYQHHDLYTQEIKYLVNDSAREDLAFISGSAPESVLISVENHLIKVLDDKDYEEPAPMGIGNMMIGEEFIVTNFQPEATAEKGEPALARDNDDDELFSLIIRNV